jgi:hypothetical protein
MKRKLPAFKADEEAARFLDRKDLSDYINVENIEAGGVGPSLYEISRRNESALYALSVRGRARFWQNEPIGMKGTSSSHFG